MGFGREEEVWEEDLLVDSMDLSNWSDRKGKIHKISEMKVSHIRNCLRMIFTGRFNKEWLDRFGDDWNGAFEAELMRRGEKV
jgi:hypothetical protein